jgi:uncharacterized protein YbjT (DUF2867 family)
MNTDILIAGATGETGRIIVSKLIEMGIRPHVLVRDSQKAQSFFGGDVIYHQGDVREPETLYLALDGINTVISAVGTRTPVGKNCPKHVDYLGVGNLIKAAQMREIERFILISSIAVTHPEHPMNCFGKVLEWKYAGEEALRQSGLKYTIIRPGGLKNTPGNKHTLIFDQGDHVSGTISRSDLAEVCINTLKYPNSGCTTFEVIEGDPCQSPDWVGLFASLQPAC